MRETKEETGLVVRLGPPLPDSRYTLLGRDGTPDDKVVRYWSARVTGGTGTSLNEIDEVVWLDVASAHARLDYARDRDQLLALVRLQQTERLDTWPLVLVRHAHAVARGDWRGDDTARPLDALGRDRAVALSGVLTAYGVTRVVSSPSERCLDTVEPYAVSAGREAAHPRGLSEEGFEAARTRPTATSPRCSSGASRRCSAPTGRCCPPCSTTWSPGSTSTPPARSRSSRSSRSPRREAGQGRGPGLPRRRHRRGRTGRRRGAPPPLTAASAAPGAPAAHATSP